MVRQVTPERDLTGFRVVDMPITPFHFGPGAALHSIAPKHVSFIAFCAANVIVDVEPLYYMITRQFPVHRFFHTYVGVSVVIAATVALFAAMLKLASVVRLPDLFRWKELTYSQVVLGAALGGYSHIVLDSVMHTDIRPLAPFSQANGLFGLVSLSSLHLFCLGAAVVGIAMVGVRKIVGAAGGSSNRPIP